MRARNGIQGEGETMNTSTLLPSNDLGEKVHSVVFSSSSLVPVGK